MSNNLIALILIFMAQFIILSSPLKVPRLPLVAAVIVTFFIKYCVKLLIGLLLRSALP